MLIHNDILHSLDRVKKEEKKKNKKDLKESEEEKVESFQYVTSEPISACGRSLTVSFNASKPPRNNEKIVWEKKKPHKSVKEKNKMKESNKDILFF